MPTAIPPIPQRYQ